MLNVRFYRLNLRDTQSRFAHVCCCGYMCYRSVAAANL